MTKGIAGQVSTPMEALINNLRLIEETVGVESIVSEHDGDTYVADCAICTTIESLACNLLIADEGQCDWSNIKMVKDAGFDVFAGERDSFGWLTGCIRTSKGIIVYG